MTETGMSLGTPHYMSPEQAMGEREITDARSDVYALGCVLYEMLTGEPPFTGPTAQAIIARVMTEEPRAAHGAARDRAGARRGGGAHGAREAAGRPLRQRRRVRGGPRVEGRSGRAGGRAGPGPAGHRSVRPLHAALIGGLLLLGALAWASTRERVGPRDFGLPPMAPLTASGGFALAPDGSFIVYPVAQGDASQLWYRQPG